MKEKPGLLRRFFGQTAFLLNMLVALWLLLCLAASLISPLQAKYLALFTITTPFAIGANVLFVFFCLFARHKGRIFLSIITLCICYRLILTVFGWHYTSSNTLAAGPGRLKVMTWNVHGLGIFDKPADNTKDDSIIEFIRREGPDILCLPEFYTIYSNALKPYSNLLLSKCGYHEFRFKDDNSLGTKIYLGTAIFSRYPIRSFQDIPLHKYVYLLQCDVVLPGDRIVRTYFVHLQSFLLSDHEKTYIEEVQNHDRDMTVNQQRNFVKRFGEAYVKRAIQADSAADIIAQSPYPVIICGDFNDLPGSYTYERMKGKLTDAFTERGCGLGRTYNMFSPTLRIDYIFYDPRFLNVLGYSSPRTHLSDHNPVIVNFQMAQNP